MKTLVVFSFIVVTTCVGAFVLLKGTQERLELTDAVRSAAPGKFINLSKGRVHYVLDGPEKSEVIIFIHGGGVTGMEVWRRNLPYFVNKGYRVLAYDLYGRGFTDRPDIVHSPEVFGGQLTELLARLELKPPYNIVSMSMGSIIALDYAEAHPENVAKMVFIDPAISGDYRPNPLLKVPVVSDILLTTYWYPRAVENQRKEFADEAVFEGYAERLRFFMGFRGYKQSNYSTWMNMLNQDRTDKIASVPLSHIMLIYGDADPYFRDSQCKKLQSKVPGIETLKVDWAGHMPQLEKPTEVNHAIHSFFKGVDAFKFSGLQRSINSSNDGMKISSCGTRNNLVSMAVPLTK
jgi:pimeloyl-ACP methyl ester carboxylesterase